MPTTEFDLINESAAWLRQRLPFEPKVGIILGTGLGNSITEITDHPAIQFHKVPHLIPTRVMSHKGNIYAAMIEEVPVILFSGRIHFYEGYDIHEIVRPVRIMQALGCTHLIVTNAAGGINPNYNTGDIVLIRDHINFPQVSPLRGMYDARWGPRFPDMSQPYSNSWIDHVMDGAFQAGLPVQTGVYALTIGPNLETPSEYAALHTLGADLVGMSTVAEVITARQYPMEVLGISVVANVCYPPERVKRVTEREIIDAVAAQGTKVDRLIGLSMAYCKGA
jgi:purine-nucleoside phosphorylase